MPQPVTSQLLQHKLPQLGRTAANALVGRLKSLGMLDEAGWTKDAKKQPREGFCHLDVHPKWAWGLIPSDKEWRFDEKQAFTASGVGLKQVKSGTGAESPYERPLCIVGVLCSTVAKPNPWGK